MLVIPKREGDSHSENVFDFFLLSLFDCDLKSRRDDEVRGSRSTIKLN